MAKYSYEFKKKVVNAYSRGEGGRRYLAKEYGLLSDKIIIQWVNDFRIAGPDALKPKRKGRRGKVTKPKEIKPRKSAGETDEAQYLQQLEEENLKLRIEEAASRGKTSEGKGRIIHSLRKTFRLKDILAVVGLQRQPTCTGRNGSTGKTKIRI